jgi:hypothetical protein
VRHDARCSNAGAGCCDVDRDWSRPRRGVRTSHGALDRRAHERRPCGRGARGRLQCCGGAQSAQIGKQWCDLGDQVLVDAVQANQRIEHQEFGFEACNGGLKGLLVLVAIEPECGHGDDVDVELLEVGAGGISDALEAMPDDVRGVLGGKQQHGAALTGREAAQARRAGGDGDGEEGFAAFGFAADDADGLGASQTLDEPSLPAVLRRGELCGTRCWQHCHGRVPVRRGLRVSGAKTSK